MVYIDPNDYFVGNLCVAESGLKIQLLNKL